ncbi:MAG: glycosyl hydrolase [Terriglobales bacterium]
MRHWLLGLSVLTGLAIGLAAQAPTVASYASLHWRYVGPPGNRTDAVAGVPGDPLTYYAGAASGGIFKSSDGGLTWHPIFDAEPDLSIGALAVAGSDHNVVWAGTGEAFIRSNISMGDGVYKSSDAGHTWTNMGLAKTGRIPRLVIDPTNPDVVLVCALGTTYAPQPERGVFRSADGGKRWTKTLFVDANTGCSGLALDPANPRILYAGMWEYEQHAWGEQSGGPSSGIYKSTDGGQTWTHLTGHGLPHAPLGKINLAVAPSQPQRVYAMIETGDGFMAHGKRTQAGVLWMSDNGGASWALMSSQVGLQSRTHYFNRVAVSSDNPNEVYFLGNTFLHSLDEGRDLARMGSPGGDNHDMWIDPDNAANMAVAHDGGISISHNRGASWNRVTLPIAQLYHIAVDNEIPYHLFGNVQDNESVRGPNRTAGGGFFGFAARIPGSDWMAVGGGESGWAQPDPVDNNIIWSSGSGDGSMGGIVTRMDLHTGQIRNVEIWPMNPLGAPALTAKYRFQWEFPLAISPFDHNTVYAASQVVHVTHDGGQSWTVISPDLTRNDKSKQQVSGGLTRDNIGVQYYDTIYALGLSPKQEGLIWAGSSDGLVQLTRDGGQHWTDVTANIPGMPVGAVRAIEPSPFAAGAAYITVDAHAGNDFAPYVFRTSDFGATWTKITNGLPLEPNGWAHDIIEDPYRPGLLFLGTEGGMYASFNNGDQWQPLQMNLPHAPVYGLVVQKRRHDLAIATYGRGFWILDDITPLENFTAAEASAAATLFAPREEYELRGGGFGRGVGIDNTVGQNPPAGAAISYYLPRAAQGRVTVSIRDAAGKTIRRLRAGGAEGFNRVAWNFRGEASAPLRAYTTPPGKPWVALNAAGWRNISARPLTLTYPPGRYTVQLSVNGQNYTQALTVLKDPRSPATPADFAAQFAFGQKLWEEQNQAAGILAGAEAVRLQLHATATALALSHASAGAALRQQDEAVDTKLVALEHKLFKNEITNQGEDIDRMSPGLAEKIEHVFEDLQSADYPPTQQEIEVNQILAQQLSGLGTQLQQIETSDVAALNAALGKVHYPPLRVTVRNQP